MCPWAGAEAKGKRSPQAFGAARLRSPPVKAGVLGVEHLTSGTAGRFPESRFFHLNSRQFLFLLLAGSGSGQGSIVERRVVRSCVLSAMLKKFCSIQVLKKFGDSGEAGKKPVGQVLSKHCFTFFLFPLFELLLCYQ